MNRKLQFGLIGVGRIGSMHVGNIAVNLRNVCIKNVCDLLEDRAVSAANEFGIENTCVNYMDILNDPEIDAVIISSNTDTHTQIIMDAARAGKHIFCEKPIDIDIGRITAALNAVNKYGVKFQVGFNRRFDHNFSRVRELISRNDLGDTHILKITSRDPHPPSIEFVETSGGLFMDMSIHDFDMARFLTGEDIEEVFAQGNVLIDPRIKQYGDVDTAVITLRFKSGALGVIDNSRQAVYGYDQRVEVLGSKGCVTVCNDTYNSVQVSTVNGVYSDKPKYFFMDRYKDAFINEISAFADAIINDGVTPVTGYDGLTAVATALAAMRSLNTGKAEKVIF